jgi:hypothetical protein
MAHCFQIENRNIGCALEAGVATGRVNDGKYLRGRRRKFQRSRLAPITTSTSAPLYSPEDDPCPARSAMPSSPPSPTPDFPTSANAQQSSLRSLRRHRAGIDIAAFAASPLAVSPKRPNDRPSTAPLSNPSKSMALKGVTDGTRMRKRSSQSLRERSKPPLVDDPAPLPSAARRVNGSAPASGAPSTIPSAEPSPPRTPEPRLGHPSRPYYTAIRKNMSQSASPRIPSPSSSPPQPASSYLAPRPSTDYTARSSTDYLGRTSGAPERPSLPMRRVGGGSVSGEMELHMALAQRRSEDTPHARQEYVFHETRAPPPEPYQRPSRLRRLSQSLRSMFFGRR